MCSCLLLRQGTFVIRYLAGSKRWAQSFRQVRQYSDQVIKEPAKPFAKDIILFKYENQKYFRLISLFGVVQFMFWTYLGQFCVRDMRDAPVDKNIEEKLSWWKSINLGENKYKNTLTAVCFLLGWGILACSWMFTLRSVRYLILNKGGDKVSIVTYTPMGPNRILTVPLNKVSCSESRLSARVQLPLKVHRITFYYLMDMRGEFRNPELFDRTAGVRRKFQ